MITDLENRRVKELEKRIADLERLVDWVTGTDRLRCGRHRYRSRSFCRWRLLSPERGGWLGGHCVCGHDVFVEFYFSESCEMVFRWLKISEPSSLVH